MNKFIRIIMSFMIIAGFFPSSILAAERTTSDQALNITSNYSQLDPAERAILDHLVDLDPGYKIQGEYISVEKQTFLIEDEAASVNGAISPSNMALYISVSRVSNPGYDTFNVSAVAEWLNAPAIRVKDGFGLAWAGNFAATSYNIVTCYKGVGVLTGKTSLLSAVPNSGLGFAVECSHYYGQALDWARIDAQLSQVDRTGVANICCTYDHATVSLNVAGVTISEKPSVTFTFGGAHDSISKMSSFQY